MSGRTPTHAVKSTLPKVTGVVKIRQFRITSRSVAIASAATTNVRTRSVQRYLISKMKRAEATKSLQSNTRHCGFFFCFFGALATLPAGFQPEFWLLKNSFLQ
jgi:hypothetical protein